MSEEDIRFVFRNVDDIDWEWLLNKLDNSGEAEFWKVVIRDIRAALGQGREEGK